MTHPTTPLAPAAGREYTAGRRTPPDANAAGPPPPRIGSATTTSILVAIAVALLLGMGGCSAIVGSGTVRTETRQVSGFTTIDLIGVGHVVIEQAGGDSLTIEAESNLLPELTSEVSNGVLSLGTKPGRDLTPTREITYHVTVKDLAGLRLSGSGAMSATAIDTPSLSIEISGSGEVTVAGDAEAQTVSIDGSGEYNAAGLNTQTATVKISGSGNATVKAEDTLDASISGSGSLTYIGNPRITKNISGSGEVRPG